MSSYPVLEVYSRRLRRKKGLYPEWEVIAFCLPDDGGPGVAPLVVLRKWSDDQYEIITPQDATVETRYVYQRIEAACGSDGFVMFIPDDDKPAADRNRKGFRNA